MRRWRLQQKPFERSSTVRYAFPAVVVFSALLGLALTISSEASYVRIDTTPTEVVAGETFTINVYASAHIPTNAVDIKLTYPERQLDILGIDVGESIITIWTEEPSAKNGVIQLRGGVFRKGFLGEHIIAQINARAVDSGVARILTSETVFLAGDGRGTQVPVTTMGGEKVEVTIDDRGPGKLASRVTIGIVTDIDGDGDVDMTDIERFLSDWHARRSSYDFNGDGRMTFIDFAILLAQSFFR
jgi:hypothetical protein